MASPVYPEFVEIPSDCWITPPEVIELAVAAMGEITFDPFHDPESLIPATTVVDIREGGDAYRDAEALVDETDKILMNGPYSRGNPPRNAELAARLRLRGASVFNICISEPGLDYWDRWIFPYADAIVWLGRLAFIAGRDILYPDGHEKAGQIRYKKGERAKNNRYSIAGVVSAPDPRRWAHLARKLLGKHTSISP